MAKKPGTEDEPSAGSQLLQSILAVRVREARRNAKLKQSDLAALVGTSQSFIFLVEAADTNITIKSLVKIAEALQIDPVHLLISKEASSLIDKKRVEELSSLIESSREELRATTANLDNIKKILENVQKILTGQKEILNATLPLQE